MHNLISFVNEQLCWEEVSAHRHDCHDPPHAVRMEFHDDQSPPRRLRGVARSDLWKAPSQVGFPGNVTRRRRPPWIVASDRWTTGRGMDYLRRNWRGEDRHPEQEIYALASMNAGKNDLELLTMGRKTQDSLDTDP